MKNNSLSSLLILILVACVGVFNSLYLTANAQVGYQGRQGQSYQGDYDDFSRSFLKFKEEKKNWEKMRSGLRNNSSLNSQHFISGERTALERAIEVMEKRLQQLEIRVKEREGLYKGVSQEILNQIRNNLNLLNQFRNRLNSANSSDELKAIANDLITYRQREREVLRKLMALANIGHFEDSIIKRAENRSQLIHQRIADLKNVGKNVVQLEDLINQADQKINQAKAKIQELKNKVNDGKLDISNLSDLRERLNEIKGLVRESYNIFRQLMIKINEIS